MKTMLIVLIVALLTIILILIGVIMTIMETLKQGNFCDEYCPYKVKIERHEQD